MFPVVSDQESRLQRSLDPEVHPQGRPLRSRHPLLRQDEGEASKFNLGELRLRVNHLTFRIDHSLTDPLFIVVIQIWKFF